MAVPFFSDIYKLFYYATKQGPYETIHSDDNIEGVGIGSVDAKWNLQNASWGGPQSPTLIQIADSQDFIDLSTVTNRKARYKEYDRLEMIPEIYTALNTFADEACLAGNTKIATPFGYITIKELADTKSPDERFLVYCWDFNKEDFSLGWAYHPRLVKTAETIEVVFDNGRRHIVTPDHRFLTYGNEWIRADEIKPGMRFKAFYRISANQELTGYKTKQFARIFTYQNGWMHERQFIDEWKLGEHLEEYDRFNKISRLFSKKLKKYELVEASGIDGASINIALRKQGFHGRELKALIQRNATMRTCIGVWKHAPIEVYDLSVEGHENFATDATIVHNCQTDDKGYVFQVRCSNEEVKDEANFLIHRLLQMDDRAWSIERNLCKYGDQFFEIIIDPQNPKRGVLKVQILPADSMYRIQTVKDRLVEFQQSQEGPDYQSLSRVEITRASESELMQATALRFHPEQVIHMKIGDDRKTFYPYGISMVEAAKGPANQLRLMEDALMVYRLCLVGNTRIRTNKSYKYIKDIQEGDVVYSYWKEKVTMPTKVLKVIDNGIQDVVRVRSRHIEIIGTKTHPVLVDREGVIQYVDMQDLKIKKDRLIITRNNYCEKKEIPRIFGEPWAKLSDEQRKIFRSRIYKNKSELLRKCHNFNRAKLFLYTERKALPYRKACDICNIFGLNSDDLIIANKGECNSERIRLPKYVNEEFARLFGFLCGDGNIHNGNQLSFATGEDPENNKYYDGLLRTFFGKTRFELNKRSEGGYGKMVVDSTIACKILTDMGYINNHDINRIPEWVFNSPVSIRRAFVEGLADADGCSRYTKKGTWFSTIELSNKLLVEDVKEVWSSIGLCSGHLKKRVREGGHEIEPGRRMPPTTSYLVTISDCILSDTEAVTMVTPLGKERVYDITVEDENHNFIANSIPVHNTHAPERRIFYIDVGQIAPNRAEAMLDRLKDQFRKKKVFSNGPGGSRGGASGVEERWNPIPPDEDFFIAMRPNSQTRIETLPGACIALDTEIPLLDGRTLTLNKIIEEYESGKQNWADSCNPIDGSPAPGKITWAGVTRKNTQVIKVTLDNGESLVCTPDHKIPVQGKGKT